MFLALAGILIPLLQRWRINQILGFLAIGALLGPFGLGLWARELPWLAYVTFPRVEGVAALGDLGVLFLLFLVGLELSAERVWALRRWVFGAGAAQIAGSALVLGAVAYALGARFEGAVILGLALALSSTAVVMHLMTEERTLGTPLGQAGFSILMMQDLAVVPLLILTSSLAAGTSGWAPAIALTAAKSVGAIVLIYFLGRRVVHPIFQMFARRRQPDVFMALTLLATLGIGALTAAAGLSMALGAFLTGLMLAETEFRHEVEITIEPFKGLFLGLFFMAVGMHVDLRAMAGLELWIPLLVVGLMGTKALVLGAVFRTGGFSWPEALAGAFLLAQGGEFAFIIIGAASSAKLLELPVAQIAMVVVALSLFVTPLAARAGTAIAERWAERARDRRVDASRGEIAPLSGHVVIAGFGRVGQLLAHVLGEQRVPFIAVESDARLAAKFHRQGLPVFFGDAARAELLGKVHAADCRAIVLTMDHPASAMNAVKAIRREFPHVQLLARSRDERHALQLKRAGASIVVPEALESSLQLSAFVLQTLGVPETAAARVIQNERERRFAALEENRGNDKQ